jgi:hypothetical protein
MIPSDENPSASQRLRSIIGTASHLDGLLSGWGHRLPADTEAVLKTDLERICVALCWLSQDVELLVLPSAETGDGMKYQGGERVEVVLVALPDDVAFSVRLRTALKYLLRTRRLRCHGLKDVPAVTQAAAGVIVPLDANLPKWETHGRSIDQ